MPYGAANGLQEGVLIILAAGHDIRGSTRGAGSCIHPSQIRTHFQVTFDTGTPAVEYGNQLMILMNTPPRSRPVEAQDQFVGSKRPDLMHKKHLIDEVTR